jgi:hypothetical protein
VELRAIPTEHRVLSDAVVDVAAYRFDHRGGPGHQADVDPALVVAVDQHHVVVRGAAHGLEDLLVEPAQGDAVLGLDDDDDVGIDLLQHPCRVLGGDLVDRFLLEFEPADPVIPSVGHDHDAAALGPLEERAAVLAQKDELALVALREPERDQVIDHRDLVGRAVAFLPEQRVELGVALERVSPGSPPGRIGTGGVDPLVLVQRPGALEQVLDVERCDPHGPLRHAIGACALP